MTPPSCGRPIALARRPACSDGKVIRHPRNLSRQQARPCAFGPLMPCEDTVIAMTHSSATDATAVRPAGAKRAPGRFELDRLRPALIYLLFGSEARLPSIRRRTRAGTKKRTRRAQGMGGCRSRRIALFRCLFEAPSYWSRPCVPASRPGMPPGWLPGDHPRHEQHRSAQEGKEQHRRGGGITPPEDKRHYREHHQGEATRIVSPRGRAQSGHPLE